MVGLFCMTRIHVYVYHYTFNDVLSQIRSGSVHQSIMSSSENRIVKIVFFLGIEPDYVIPMDELRRQGDEKPHKKAKTL